MRLIERGWRAFKSNPLVNLIFILVIFLGILLLVMITIVGFSKEKGTEVVEGDQMGFGYGHGIQKGDIIEVEYDIQGEDVDVYIIKEYILPFDKDDEDILVSKPDSQSGSITYEAKEKGMHMVYFNGKDFTVNYSYQVIKPLFSLFMVVVGFAVLGIGIAGLWYYNHIPNPKYLDNYLKYLTVGSVFLGVIFLWVVIIYPMDFIFNYLTPFYMIFLGLQSYFMGKVYNKQYQIKSPLKPEECAIKIKEILGTKGIKYCERKTVKKRGSNWHAIFDLEGTDMKIKIRKLYFSQDKSYILIGKQNAINKNILVKHANSIAKDLECKNYTPISV